MKEEKESIQAKPGSRTSLPGYIISVLLLVVSPVVMFCAVQMITWLSGQKQLGHIMFRNVVKSLTEIPADYVIKNMWIYIAVLFVLILIFRKIRWAVLVYGVLLTVITLVNYYVVMFRGQAFMLLDVLGMGTAADVMGNYSFTVPRHLKIILFFEAAFLIFQFVFQKLELGKKSRKNLICRMGSLVILFIVAVQALPLLKNAQGVNLWNVNKDYTQKGYLYTLLLEARYIGVEKPDGYSPQKVDEILAENEKETSEEKKTAAGNQTVPQNIIMIMNESLADFESTGDLQTDTEILPFIHSLNKNVTYGKLHVPTFGGGTARSEYEALTGNSIQFFPAACQPYELYVRDPEYGLADILGSQDYELVAMHPNNASNWNRSKVYVRMGFDEFLSIENWGDEFCDRVRKHYYSDATVYDKIIKMYEDKEEDQKLFTFCVTMQNHGGYDETTNGEDYEPDVKLNYDEEYPYAETYLSLARQSDLAFKDLLTYFEKVDEPTMIVMFGDHWPQLEDGFFEQLLGKKKSSLETIESQITYTTPYIIWTNYPSETKEEDISCNYLGSSMLEKAGVQLTEYEQFLANLKEELPIIGVGAVCDKDGNWYTMDDLPEKYQTLLNEYQILQYNNQLEKKQIRESAFTVE